MPPPVVVLIVRASHPASLWFVPRTVHDTRPLSLWLRATAAAAAPGG